MEVNKNCESENVNGTSNNTNNEHQVSSNNDTNNETNRKEAEPPPKTAICESRHDYNIFSEAGGKAVSNKSGVFHQEWKEIRNGKPRKILCNINSCQYCNENWKPKSNNDNNNENNKNVKKTYKRILECLKDCAKCRRIIDRANNRDAWGDYTINEPIKPENQQSNNEPEIIIDLERDNNAEIERKIKSMRITRFETKLVASNGNCLYTSMEVAMGRSSEGHVELRQWCADCLETYPFAEEVEKRIFAEQGCEKRVDYVAKMRKDKFYGGSTENQVMATHLHSWIAVYIEDERYKAQPWQIFKGTENERPVGLIFLKFRQGREVIRDAEGHYSALWIKGEHKTGVKNIIIPESPRVSKSNNQCNINPRLCEENRLD